MQAIPEVGGLDDSSRLNKLDFRGLIIIRELRQVFIPADKLVDKVRFEYGSRMRQFIGRPFDLVAINPLVPYPAHVARTQSAAHAFPSHAKT
jgi:hypothetical protein